MDTVEYTTTASNNTVNASGQELRKGYCVIVCHILTCIPQHTGYIHVYCNSRGVFLEAVESSSADFVIYLNRLFCR